MNRKDEPLGKEYVFFWNVRNPSHGKTVWNAFWEISWILIKKNQGIHGEKTEFGGS